MERDRRWEGLTTCVLVGPHIHLTLVIAAQCHLNRPDWDLDRKCASCQIMVDPRSPPEGAGITTISPVSRVSGRRRGYTSFTSLCSHSTFRGVFNRRWTTGVTDRGREGHPHPDKSGHLLMVS